MPRNRKTDHVVIDGKTGRWECRHCGVSIESPLKESLSMASVSVVTGAMNGFVEEHADCPKPKAEEASRD